PYASVRFRPSPPIRTAWAARLLRFPRARVSTKVPTETRIFGNCRRIAAVLFHYSLTECFRASLRSIQHMKTRFRLYQRDTSKPQGERVFYSFDNETKKQKSLGTRNRKEAVRLVAALNEANQQPSINRQIAVGYLLACDVRFKERTWRYVLDTLISLKHGTTKERWQTVGRDEALEKLWSLPLIQTQ